MNINSLLHSVGLTPSEADLYLISLELGSASAIQLGQKAGITRQRVYAILPSLKEKGLIKEVSVGRRQYYQAVNPDALADLAEQSVRRIRAAIPDLKARQAGNAPIPLVTVYDNSLSMREWYRQCMRLSKKDDQMLIWSAGINWYDLDPDFYASFTAFKAKKGVHDYILTGDTPEAHSLEATIGTPTKEFRYLPDWQHTECEMWIWHDQMVYLTIKEHATSLIVVESPLLAALERDKFWKAWNTTAAQ